MELEVKPDIEIKDGHHEGVITGIEYREKPYEYTDLVIEFEEGQKLKYGVPTSVTPKSMLGRLFADFRFNVDVGKKVQPEWLIGKKCTFMTMKEGKFSNIVKGSLKPGE